MDDARFSRVLVVRAPCHGCALNLEQVIEVTRLLPINPIAGAPETVQGLAVIRGAPVPVVSLAMLFGEKSAVTTRLVVVRTGDRRAALAVDEVLGIRGFSRAALSALPPLARNAAAGTLEAIGVLDSELIFLLNSASVIPEELLQEPIPRGGDGIG